MEKFDFITTKSVYTSWSDDELFISIERERKKGDGEYDEMEAALKYKCCKNRYIITSLPFPLGHEEADKVVLSVEVEGSHYMAIAISKERFNKLMEMVAAVNAEFERS